MSRQSTAHLAVTVADEQLVAHIARMGTAKETWEAMVAAVKALGTGYTTEAGKSVKDLGEGMKAFGSVKGENIKAAAEALGKIGDVQDKLHNMGGSVGRLAPLMETLAESTKKWATELGKAATYVDKLDKRIESLIQSQQKTEKHLENFEGKLQIANAALKEQGQDLLKLVQGYAGFNKAVDSATAKQNKAAEVTQSRWKKVWGGIEAANEGARDFQRGFIRNATALFIAGQWVKHAAAELREAAQEMDLRSVMASSVGNWTKILEDTRKSTRGMISDLQILKSGALMSSFDIPMENFAQNMELVQKMAVRTGQSSEYMFDSFARGIARQSAPILDNLGIQVKLGDAYRVQAAMMGVSTDKLDKHTQKLAIMNEVVRQLMDKTGGVEPGASYASRLDQMTTKFDNWWAARKADFLGAVFKLSDSSENTTANWLMALKQASAELQQNGRIVTEDLKEVAVSLNTADPSDFVRHGIHLDLLNSLMNFGVGETSESRPGLRRVIDMNLAEITRYIAVFQPKMDTLKAIPRELRELQDRAWETAQEFRGRAWEAQGRGDPRLEEQAAGLVKRAQNIDTFLLYYESAGARIEKARKDMMAFTAGMSQGEAGIWQEAARQEADKLRKTLGEFVGKVLLDPTGTVAGSFKGISNKLFEEMSKRIPQVAKAAIETSRQTQAADYARLQLILQRNQQHEIELSAMQGVTSANVVLQRAEQQHSQEKEVFDKLRAERSKDEGLVTLDQLEAQQKLLTVSRDRLTSAKELARIADFSVEFAKNQTFWTESMLVAEKERLRDGLTKMEIEARLVGLQIHMNAELERQKQLQYDITGATKDEVFQKMLLAGMSGMFDAAAFTARAMEAERLLKALATFEEPKGSGGRGGRAAKDKKDTLDVTEDIYTTMRNVDEWMGDLLVVRGQQVQKTWIWIGDTLHNVGTTVKNMSRDVLAVQGGPKNNGLLGSLFWGNSVEDLETNEATIKRLMELAAKGGWTDAMMVRKNELELANIALREHIDLWMEAAKALHDYGLASEWAFKHADQILGDDVIRSMQNLATNVGALGEVFEKAMKGQAGGYELLGASLNIVRGFTNEYIKNLRARASVEAVFNAAMAWAAYPNVPKMIAHGTAATMFAAVGLGAVRLPGQARGDDRQAAERSGGPMHFHLYSEMAMTDAERGYLIDRSMSQAAAEGRI